MLVTLPGIFIFTNSKFPPNANSLISTTVSGIFIFFNFSQPKNAIPSIFFTPLGILYCSLLLFIGQVIISDFSFVNNTPSSLIYLLLLLSTLIFVKFSHQLNAIFPILVTLLGIFILVKLLQKKNACSPILSNFSGKSIFSRPHPKNASFPILTTLLGMLTTFNASQ